jgi:hypothetical protein
MLRLITEDLELLDYGNDCSLYNRSHLFIDPSRWERWALLPLLEHLGPLGAPSAPGPYVLYHVTRSTLVPVTGARSPITGVTVGWPHGQRPPARVTFVT